MGHPRRFRFGVIAKAPRPGAEFGAYAQRIESLGYFTLFMPDHFVDQPLAPMPGIAYAAALVGTIDEMCADLEARRERWQMSYVVVPEEFSDVFAPVAARLAGT